MMPPNEHVVTQHGWTVVMVRRDRSEFFSYGEPSAAILGRSFHPARGGARAQLRELRKHGMRGYVSRATVELRRHK